MSAERSYNRELEPITILHNLYTLLRLKAFDCVYQGRNVGNRNSLYMAMWRQAAAVRTKRCSAADSVLKVH